MNNDRNFLIHPSYIILFLVIAAIISLFIGFSGAYLFNRIDQDIPPIKLPSLFYWNTLILLGSSGTLLWAKKSYKSDHLDHYKYSLIATLILTIAFLFSQILAWQQLQNNDVFVDYNNMASYLYVISGLHYAHVLVGVPFLIYFIIDAFRRLRTPVDILIYFTDKRKMRRLNLLNVYWHFLDGLWIYLVLFFLINFMLQ